MLNSHRNRSLVSGGVSPRPCAGNPLPNFRCPNHQTLGPPRRRTCSVVVRANNTAYYDLLGVSKTADKKTIKSAYRQQARKFHPDVNKEPGAEEKFKKIGEAYEVLSDDDKKSIYDRFGEAGLKGMGGGGGMGAAEFSNPFDLFESFFGGGFGGGGGGGGGPRNRNRPTAGEDQRHDLQLDFMEGVFGCTKEIEVDRLEQCSVCSSTGMKTGTTASTCNTCQGSGQLVQAVRTPLGVFQQVSSCPACQGQGQISVPCEECGGDGRVRKFKRISLKVPQGVDNGSRLRVRGEGNSGRRDGPVGDLYVFLNIKEHPELRREGTTIHSDVDVSYVDAILGTQTKVATVDGPVELKIPAGTQPATTLLMAKRGVPRLGNAVMRGDHQVHVRVVIPKQLKEEEKQLVEQLRELQKKNVPSKGIFGF